MGCVVGKQQLDNGLEAQEERKLAAAKKKAATERRKSLKMKRQSAPAAKEWDPSGTAEQGPAVGVKFDDEKFAPAISAM